MIPLTYIGRAITIISAIFGLFFTATLVGLISSALVINDEESIVISYIKDSGNLKMFKNSALQCIIETIRTYALTRNLKLKEQKPYRKKLAQAAMNFKEMRL